MSLNLAPEERAAMTAGASMWKTASYPEHGIPSLTLSDGPMGIASPRVDEREIALLTPCPTALGASWDLDLCHRIGALVGGEAIRRGVDMVLAPNVNLARSPLAGRAFEYFSEEPLLAGLIGAAWAVGLQATGTGAVVKHMVCNDSETDRDRMSAVVDERTLREIYLLPFELCLNAGVGGVLMAYNRLNGDWCAEQHHIITTIVKGEWAYPGVVMSDWFATHSTVNTLRGGLDLEMPGPGRFLGAKSFAAVREGDIDQARVDDAAERVALAARKFGGQKEILSNEAEESALLIEAATAGFVMVKNDDGILPLSPRQGQKIAVIGPNATVPCYQGGTFAKISVSPDVQTPLAALKSRLGKGADIEFEAGVDPEPRLPSMPVLPFRDLGDGCTRGMTVDYFDGPSDDAALIASETRDSNSLVWFRGVHDDVARLDRPARITARGTFTATETGTHEFYIGATGPVVLLVDGEEKFARREPMHSSDVMGKLKSGVADMVAIHLAAGQDVSVEVRFSYDVAHVHGLWYGIRQPDRPDEMLARAIDLAGRSDTVILIVGETPDASVESKDRQNTKLADEQLQLIEAVTAANPRTIIIGNVGHAFDISWEDRAAAVIIAWYPGEGFGEALAQVLVGDAEPGGRMPVSIARNEDDYPAFDLMPDSAGNLIYSDGVHVGYRGMKHPRYTLGFGLGYADIVLLNAALNADGTASIEVENQSLREGSEVIQIYRREPCLALVGFQKVRLAPGERRQITVAIEQRQLRTWQDGWKPIPHPRLFAGLNAADVAFEIG